MRSFHNLRLLRQLLSWIYEFVISMNEHPLSETSLPSRTGRSSSVEPERDKITVGSALGLDPFLEQTPVCSSVPCPRYYRHIFFARGTELRLCGPAGRREIIVRAKY